MCLRTTKLLTVNKQSSQFEKPIPLQIPAHSPMNLWRWTDNFLYRLTTKTKQLEGNRIVCVFRVSPHHKARSRRFTLTSWNTSKREMGQQICVTCWCWIFPSDSQEWKESKFILNKRCLWFRSNKMKTSQDHVYFAPDEEKETKEQKKTRSGTLFFFFLHPKKEKGKTHLFFA